MKDSLSRLVQKDFRAIPPQVKHICLNFMVFTLGWGLGTDTFWSVYMEGIFGNLFLMGVLVAASSFLKLVLNLPVGQLDGSVDKRKLIISGKIIYAFSSVFAFLAGAYQSPLWMVLSLIAISIANPMVYTSYAASLRELSNKRTSCQIFGIYNASEGAAYCGTAFVTALLVPHFELHWFYVFAIFFPLLSIYGDLKMPHKPGKKIFPELKRIVVKDKVYKRIYKDLRSYDYHLYFILFLQFLWGLLDFASFLFIPLLAAENTLSLPQIAIIFGLTRMPYMLSFFFAELADRKGRMMTLAVSLVLTSCLLAILGLSTGFGLILISSLALSLCLATIRPIVGGVLTNLVMPKQRSEMTGVEEFLSKAGQIVGSLSFGLFAELFSIGFTFLALSVLVFGVSLAAFAMRSHQRKSGLLEWINTPMGIFHFHPHFHKKKRRAA